MTRAAVLSLVLLLSGRSWAKPWLVESSAQTDRSSAQALADALDVTSDMAKASVVRRFERGMGWGFIVQVQPVDDIAAARGLADLLATASGPARIFDVEGRKQVLVEIGAGTVAPPRDASAPAPAAPALDRDAEAAATDRSADGVLRAAVKAHGGRSGGLKVLSEAQGIEMTFERTVAMGEGSLAARHHLVRLGSALRLDVSILQGEGVDSVTVLRSPGDAWITADGSSTRRDPSRTHEVLERFTPERLLAVPLGLPNDVGTTRAWRGLVMGEPLGQDTVVLVPGPDHDESGLVLAAFDGSDDTLQQLIWSTDAGKTTFAYGDYREVGRSLIVPFQVRIERDGVLVEELKITEFVVDPVLDPALFERPDSLAD